MIARMSGIIISGQLSNIKQDKNNLFSTFLSPSTESDTYLPANPPYCTNHHNRTRCSCPFPHAGLLLLVAVAILATMNQAPCCRSRAQPLVLCARCHLCLCFCVLPWLPPLLRKEVGSCMDVILLSCSSSGIDRQHQGRPVSAHHTSHDVCRNHQHTHIAMFYCTH